MGATSMHVLVVEDNDGHVALIQQAFRRRQVPIRLSVAGTLAEGHEALATAAPDLVLADLRLPDGLGTELLPDGDTPCRFPLVIMTGQGDEHAAVAAMKSGALDYVVKSAATLQDMPHIVSQAMRQWESLVARRRAEEELRKAHDELERRVEQRTAELAEANEHLRREVEERRRAEEAVRREQRSLLRLLELHERDRKLIAFEIHDGFAQHLTAAHFLLDAVCSMDDANAPKARGNLRMALGWLKKALTEARRLIGGLRPPVLDDAGIVASIDYLISELDQEGTIQSEFVHDPVIERMAPPLESAVFRIVQECLTNVRRYSQSPKVRVELGQSRDRVRVEVRDWGVGFDPAQVKGGRFGLEGIRERARLFGGRSEIDSGPGRGTRILVELPLAEPSNGE